MDKINNLSKKVKLKVLGDPAKCIITFKIKVGILYIAVVYILFTIITWLKN